MLQAGLSTCRTDAFIAAPSATFHVSLPSQEAKVTRVTPASTAKSTVPPGPFPLPIYALSGVTLIGLPLVALRATTRRRRLSAINPTTKPTAEANIERSPQGTSPEPNCQRWRNLSLALYARSRQSLRISNRSEHTMACPERLRLQQLFEVSVRRWAQVAASSQLFGQPTSLTDDVRLRVLADRNAAKNRLLAHQQKCKRCLRSRMPGFPPTDDLGITPDN